MDTVFHVSAGDPDAQASALNSVSNLLADDTVDVDAVAVVVNGAAIDVVARGSVDESRVGALLDAGVTVSACENSLEGADVDRDRLLDGVETVASGVGELARLQGEGYGYIRP